MSNEVFNYQEMLDKGYRSYCGDDLVVFFNRSLCKHLAFCIRGNKEVFNLKTKPWIQPDNANKEDIIKVIDQCTSGALKYYQGEDTHELKLHRRK